MARERTAFERIYKAAVWRAQRAVERFAAPAEQSRHDPERDRSKEGLKQPFNGDQAWHSGLVSGLDQLALAPPDLKDKGEPGRPPKHEFVDLPISTWLAWNVQTARSVLADHAVGMFGRSGLLVESMLGDDRVQSTFNGYVKLITKCEPNLVPADVPGGEEAALELEEAWEDMLPEEEVEQLFQWARFEGFALAEVIWEPWANQSRWRPRLKVWHPLFIWYNIQNRCYVAITGEGAIDIYPDDPKWLLFTPNGAYRGWLRGAVRCVTTPWLVRQFALRDAARFAEVHGLPIRLAKVPAQAPAEDKARFFQSIRNLGAESVMLLPVQAGPDAAVWGAELLEAKDTSWEVFPAIRDMCDSAITLAIRGTNLTTSVGTGNSGNKAAAETHRDEDQDYAVAERRKFCKLVRTQLFRFYCIFNFGTTDVVPKRVTLIDPDGEDVQGQLKSMSDGAKLVVELRGTGHKVEEREVLERAGVPLVEENPDAPTELAIIDVKDLPAVVTVDEARAGRRLAPHPDPTVGKSSVAKALNDAKPAPVSGGFGGGFGASSGSPSMGDAESEPTEPSTPEP